MAVKDKIIPGGTYKCTEDKLYLAHFMSTHDVTKEQVLVYESLGDHTIHHCPVENFAIPEKFVLVKHPSPYGD